MKLALIDDVDRFWSFWTTWWNVAWASIGAAATAVFLNEETRAIVLNMMGLTPDQILVLTVAAIPAITAGSLVLRRLKQTTKAPPSPETEPNWHAIDSTDSPTVPMRRGGE
jgi:hypothetical protein